MKRILLLLPVLSMLLSLSAAAADSVSVRVDGTPLTAAAAPCLRDGTAYVPLRAFFDAIDPGCTVFWDGTARQATVNGDGYTLSVTPGEPFVTIDGLRCRTGAAAWLSPDGVLMAPVRPMAAVCGVSVSWDDTENAVLIRRTEADASIWAEEDLFWLAHIIYAESGAEPLEGQIAVGNVVLNRVASAAYPDTIRDVIFDTAGGVQFEPVENGTVWNEPGPVSLLAARLVLRGASGVENSLFFFDPALSEGTWIRTNCTYLTTIGGHRFYF